jgi:hypothetical protein
MNKKDQKDIQPQNHTNQTISHTDRQQEPNNPFRRQTTSGGLSSQAQVKFGHQRQHLMQKK